MSLAFFAVTLTKITILKKHLGNKVVEGFIANQGHEMQLYYKHNAFYGYVFYIGKKI